MPNPDRADRQPSTAGPTRRCVAASAARILWSAVLLYPLLSPADEAQSSGLSPRPPGSTTASAPAPIDLALPVWFDEVRAQRQAAEERHQARREAGAARRRAGDPRATAQREAWEAEVQRRRATRQLRIEQERHRFRALGTVEHSPWAILESPQAAGTDQRGATAATEPEHSAYPPGAFSRDPPSAAGTGHYAPQEWDNLWYYRGY